MDSLLLILIFGTVLGLILVFKQQPKGGTDDYRGTSEGSEEE